MTKQCYQYTSDRKRRTMMLNDVGKPAATLAAAAAASQHLSVFCCAIHEFPRALAAKLSEA